MISLSLDCVSLMETGAELQGLVHSSCLLNICPVNEAGISKFRKAEIYICFLNLGSALHLSYNVFTQQVFIHPYNVPDIGLGPGNSVVNSYTNLWLENHTTNNINKQTTILLAKCA